MAKIAGTAEITINGEKHLLRGNMKVAISDKKRETIMGLDGYHGVKETLLPCYIECDLTDRPSLDPKILAELSDATVIVRLINGKTATLRNATQINQIEVNAEDGLFTVRFEGPSGEWSTVT